MSLTIIILTGAIVLLLGVALGYYLRVIIALGQRRSIEIDIKQMMVGAKEEAQRIIDEAKTKSEEKLAKIEEEEKKKTEKPKNVPATMCFYNCLIYRFLKNYYLISRQG